MKRSIFAKIFAGYLSVALGLSALILAFSFRTIRNHYLDTLSSDLENLGVVLKSSVIPLLESENIEELNALTKRLGRQTRVRITVINTEGVVYADSEEDPELMENHGNRPEVRQALKGRIGKSLRSSTTVKEEMLYVATPLHRDDELMGVLRVSLFLKDVKNLLADLRRRILYIASVVVVVSLAGAILLSKTISNPVKELAQATEKVASGDFDVRVWLENRDELRELADGFNYMTEKIQALFRDLSHQKEELASVISSIEEGLLVLDSEGKITLSNESLKRTLQADSVEGKFYWEVLREPELSSLVKRVTEEEKNLTGEIELDGRVFLCSATFMSSTREMVLIFHDITEVKNLEKVKRDFVTSVSHELRTPLAAIKGFVETIEEEIDKKHKHYLDIIGRHTDRLISIVQDLLLLSELEEREAQQELEEVNLSQLIQDVLKIFEPRVREKGLSLALDVDSKLPSIKGEPFRLEQMFVNLLDNAVKYTEEGEIKISVAPQDQQVRIEIEDTGLGIAREHLGRVFERFYVVDKSRSRELGGTGLGLSIVKHIVLAHNGSINVESELGKGSKFVIDLPVNPS